MKLGRFHFPRTASGDSTVELDLIAQHLGLAAIFGRQTLPSRIGKNGKNQNRLFRLFWGRRCWQPVSLSFLFFYTAVPFWGKKLFL